MIGRITRSRLVSDLALALLDSVSLERSLYGHSVHFEKLIFVFLIVLVDSDTCKAGGKEDFGQLRRPAEANILALHGVRCSPFLRTPSAWVRAFFEREAVVNNAPTQENNRLFHASS